MFKSLIILLFILSCQVNLLAQQDREAQLKGYNDTNYFRYFDSVHQISRQCLKELRHPYDFYVVFKVDTNAIVSDIEILEIPGISIPEMVRMYVRKLIISSNGNWWPEISNSHKVKSDEMIYRVSISKKDGSFEEGMMYAEKLILGALKNDMLNEKIIAFDHSDKKKYILLSY